MTRFHAGQSIVLREVLDGRLWATYAGISVRDDDEWIATYVPSGSPIVAPVSPTRPFDRAAKPSEISWQQRTWHTTNALFLARPGEPWTRATMWIAVAPKKCRVRGELQFARNEMRLRELNAA